VSQVGEVRAWLEANGFARFAQADPEGPAEPEQAPASEPAPARAAKAVAAAASANGNGNGKGTVRLCAYCNEQMPPTAPMDQRYCDRLCRAAEQSDRQERRRALPWSASLGA
jgi:hypothetical protein